MYKINGGMSLSRPPKTRWPMFGQIDRLAATPAMLNVSDQLSGLMDSAMNKASRHFIYVVKSRRSQIIQTFYVCVPRKKTSESYTNYVCMCFM